MAGGERILEETGGYFVQPTIFDGVQRHADRPGGDLRAGAVGDRVRCGGGGRRDRQRHLYGLAASIYTDDLNVAHRVAREIRAGTVGVNAYAEGDMTTPFGGYKQSGFGGHDKSIHAHDQYTELKTTWIVLKGTPTVHRLDPPGARTVASAHQPKSTYQEMAVRDRPVDATTTYRARSARCQVRGRFPA